MSSNDHEILWQTKLHARLHDPAEKALVLLRDPAGHEGGNSRVLWRMARHDEVPAEGTLDNDNADVLHAVAFSGGIKPGTYKTVQRADWWAAAADRPQWPMQEITVNTKSGEKTFGVAHWARVHWTSKPILIHPLTGDQYDLGRHGGLSETDFQDVKQRAFDHLSRLLMRDGGITDFRKSLLALWRFGPELTEETDNGKLGELWKLLPADTRVPDHSIWDHLDLTSAFAGAFAADDKGEAALLSLSIGPVQPFIASARKMDDLWAGSHLLARLSWEAMRVVCERLGPDAILFPRLRGVPQVDLWLRDQIGLPDDLFNGCDWQPEVAGSTDSNPLFSAALPNRFVAVVPASQAKAIAEAVQTAVRAWLQTLGRDVVIALLKEAGHAGEQEGITTPFEQMQAQLEGFPEVHWAAVPFSLIGIGDRKKQTGLDTTQLSAAMRPFFEGDGEPGFLDTPAWQLLQKEIELVDDSGRKSVFFAPNPGVLYPAVHDLAERALAAAKSVRNFAQTRHQGWRCSLTGEAEWLTTDREQLGWNKNYRQKQGTLWTKVAQTKPAWAKAGEHLAALPAIKRLWPTLYLEEVNRALDRHPGDKDGLRRFVVSTHTMALAHQLKNFGNKPLPEELQTELAGEERVALPRALAPLLHRHSHGNLLARIPGWLDAARESDDEKKLRRVQGALRNLFDATPETYYALLMMDGDRMGAILSGDESTDTTISYRDSFHPQVQSGFDKHADKQPEIKRYGNQKRAITPNRHLAISGALNDFSLTVVRHVVENEHLGRLIYAGGDDVFAMLPVADLLPAMQRLRHVYSGTTPEDKDVDWEVLKKDKSKVHCKNGFAYLNGKLMRMMGSKATASSGAVIAHHQAPLAAVRRELTLAEQRAKNEGGRDAFSITIVKRSGGALRLTAKWGEPIKLLQDLRTFLATDGVSRRAAYHTLQWLNDHELPPPEGDGAMLQTLLGYQLSRQSASSDARANAEPLAQRLTALTLEQPLGKRINWLRNFISVAEFLAREMRTTAGETHE